ncbi:hydroxyacid dehydrogenase [Candidatus Parcubacteria bacterium]|nr:hydroxyacid dehydrogenase [Candidatus Parcubacteria bacterium]
MSKIVITQDLGLNKEEIIRLEKLGELKMYDDLPKTPDEWLSRCQGADIVCSGKFGLKTEKLYELKDVFFSLPFVGVSFIDRDKIKERNITVSYCPGCNKEAVSEWIVAMTLNLFREFPRLINNLGMSSDRIPKETLGLMSKKVTILGKGNIGSTVGDILSSLKMDVSYFKRGDDLIESVKEADLVINTISTNPSTLGFLNKSFFISLKKGSFFITVTGTKIYDIEGMFEALDQGILAGVANDSGGIQVGDTSDPFFKRLVEHPKVLATPHISYNTDVTDRVASKMMIDNIEAWINGNPINLIF